MRPSLYDLIEQLARAVDLPEPVVEFGALRAAQQAALPSIRTLLPGKDFIGTDVAPGAGVDQVQDLHSLTLPAESVGTAILLDTIEHVRNPWQAMQEVHRVLRPGGLVVVTSVFFFPVHAHPDDYWRFTASALDVLLEPFDVVRSAAAGHELLPHTVAAVAARAPIEPDVWAAAAAGLTSWSETSATSWKERALMLAPPTAMLAFYRMYAGRQRQSRASR